MPPLGVNTEKGETLPLLTTKDRGTGVGAAINSRLDYCNILYAGAPKGALNTLQELQNVGARAIPKRRSISAGVKSLHWLRIEKGIQFKLGCLAHTCCEGTAPRYLIEKIHPYSPGRTLCSSGADLFSVPKIKTKKNISYAVPMQWNSLGVNIGKEKKSTSN